jgi:geranylgeranyl diphosphate synthase type II
MEFKIWFESKASTVDAALESMIEGKKNPQGIIYEAMNYSLMSGGKRLRPVLLLGTYEIFKNDFEKAIPFACAMEMIHTYSLIHDDLPAMDDDDYRRGRLSNHKKFGEAVAILAGDALLNKAFETGLEAVEKYNLDVRTAARAMSLIAASSGTEGMIGGRIVDMFGSTKVSTIEDLNYMYSKKTGAIIKSSILAGAVLGGAGEEELKALEIYAEKVGLAFQIEDDVLDVTSTQEVLGKPIGSDEANNKTTYLSFMNIEEAMEFVGKLTDEAVESLNIFGDKSYYLIELAKYLTKRDH